MHWLELARQFLKWWLMATVYIGIPFCVFWALWRAREKRICNQHEASTHGTHVSDV